MHLPNCRATHENTNIAAATARTMGNQNGTHNTTDTADTDTADTAVVGDAGAEGFVGLVLADSAYASGESLDAFAAAGYDTAIKPINPKPRITGDLTRDDFTIDTDAQTVTCPAGHTKTVKSGSARFGALCLGCPLRARCTTAAAGRSVTVDEHHHRRQANKTRWAQPTTQAAYRDSTAPWPNAPSRGSPATKPDASPTAASPPTPLAHHQSRSRQPHAPHQPRRHPQQRRLHPLNTAAAPRAPNPNRHHHPHTADSPHQTAPTPATTSLAQQSTRRHRLWCWRLFR